MSRNPKPTPFKNPLLQPSDKASGQSSDTLAVAVTPNLTFEMTHKRMTTWLDIELTEPFDALCKKVGKGARTRLVNEAIADLLRKYKVR